MAGALLRGQWLEALRLNPLVFAVLVGGALWLGIRVLGGRQVVLIESARDRKWATAAIIAAVLGNWAYVLTLV